MTVVVTQNNITSPNADVTALTVGTANGLKFPNAGPLSNRNLIINGAMQVAQRGTQTTGVTASGYIVDRLNYLTAIGTWTIDQSTDSPAGFSNSAKITCTTANASPAANAYVILEYHIEAQDLQYLDYGASTAQALKLSFWAKSNKTGSASFEIQQPDNSYRQYVANYSISSAGTWEYKTISIPADTAGVINNDNGSGLRLRWWLNSGSDYQGGSASTAWATTSQSNSNFSNLGLGGATSDYFQITGIQLEAGTVATPFEHRSYGQELALCERYYQILLAGNTSGGLVSTGNYTFATPFKTVPRTSSTGIVSYANSSFANASSLTCVAAGIYGINTSYTATASGYSGVLYTDIIINAEL